MISQDGQKRVSVSLQNGTRGGRTTPLQLESFVVKALNLPVHHRRALFWSLYSPAGPPTSSSISRCLFNARTLLNITTLIIRFPSARTKSHKIHLMFINSCRRRRRSPFHSSSSEVMNMKFACKVRVLGGAVLYSIQRATGAKFTSSRGSGRRLVEWTDGQR